MPAVPALRVSVEVPLPGAAIGLGEKLSEAPAGSPVTDSVIAALYPFSAAVVMVVWPEPPGATVTDVGDAPIEKSGVFEKIGWKISHPPAPLWSSFAQLDCTAYVPVVRVTS